MGKQTRTAMDDYSVPSHLNPETRAYLREVLEREQKYQDDEKQPRIYGKALGDDSFAGTSLWLERTRWPIIYKNVRRDILQEMTRIPSFRKIDFEFSSNFVLGQIPICAYPRCLLKAKGGSNLGAGSAQTHKPRGRYVMNAVKGML
jgi:hypothetical protein